MFHDPGQLKSEKVLISDVANLVLDGRGHSDCTSLKRACESILGMSPIACICNPTSDLIEQFEGPQREPCKVKVKSFGLVASELP